ncbi:MAG TPA: Mur ligase family protein [Solirubrobacteraceae bacterium]|nr:Mur ligase family protein [Solirubrobacteraceae bacterium]
MHTPEHARGVATSAGRGSVWTPAQAERHLRSLELFGMRFGLDRMRRMMTVLDAPQRRLHAVHVLGTNGKSSTTRMIAAILERHGVRTGSYTSPHLISDGERLRIGERDVAPETFAAAIGRAVWAAERVDRTLDGDDHVTQFELLTAAALSEMAEQEVRAAVVEAGLGGRYDATSVIEAPVTVLTNVALEHTRWLGPTVRDIAGEKLAVVHPEGTLVLGPWLDAEAVAVAEHVAGERGARIVWAGREDLGDGILGSVGCDRVTACPELRARGLFQQRNFALARVAAEIWLRGAGIDLDERAVCDAARGIEVPGRMQLIGDDPPTVLDGAHNPHAVAALVESLPAVIGGRRPALVMGVLEDKDAVSMLRTLLPLCERAWFTAPHSSRALPPAALQSLARQLGFHAVACEPRPERALAQARLWAREGSRAGRGEDARAVLATGSVYLVGELLHGLYLEGEAG